MNDDGTMKPGNQVEAAIAARWKAKLETSLEGRLDATMASNVPMACRLVGVDRIDLFEKSLLNSQMEVFAFFENVNEMRRTTVLELRNYLACKEPWEDYDICVFDESLDWFVGCSHSDRIIVSGEDAFRRVNGEPGTTG